VPGSAHLGNPLSTGGDAAVVAGSVALVARSEGVVLLRGLEAASPEAVAIEGSMAGAILFAFADDGASAAVYSASRRQVQVIRDLAKSPVAGTPVDVALDAVSVLAFDGEHMVAGAAGGVWLLTDGAPKRLVEVAHPADLEIHGRDLFVADRDGNRIWQVLDFAAAATPLVFADERSGILSPAGIEVLNGRLVVASAAARAVDAFELATHTLASHVDLDFTPTRLEALGRQGLAVLNSPGEAEPLWVLDAGERFGVYFVPAGREE